MHLPRIGFGGGPIGGLFRAVTDEQAEDTIDAALAAGITYFDTAPLYGHGLSERRLGAVLRLRPRASFVLSTKVGRLLRPGGEPQDFWRGVPAVGPVFDFSAEGVRSSLEESLERLGLDRVDVLFIHDPDDHFETARDEAYPALHALRDEGTVAAVGVGINQLEITTRFVEETDIDVVLLAGRYTLLDRSAAESFLPLCMERGIRVVIGGVFNSGLLAGGTTYDYEPAPKDLVDRAAALKATCERFGVPLKAAALQFPLRHPAVSTVLLGARTAEEVEENIRLLHMEIPEELWDQLSPS